ncbi:MAG: prepilin-type N-terminal cleavage/methylation domain-containing protein [Phycisphaerae bacterium]|nr:prepilin-type N-terminal cleavage/methylation domain-containing protein [Phycisphaerae bacterium]
MRSSTDVRAIRHGYTLIEVLVVVVVLGIAGALVIPSMGSTGILRVQAAVRSVVSDIVFCQADAVAFQERRAIVFDSATTYRLVQVPGSVIDIEHNTLYDPSRPSGLYVVDVSDPRYGDARINSALFDSHNYLVFDEQGAPLGDLGTNTAGSGGTVTITGSEQTFDVTVDAFTGRVSVQRRTEQGQGN